MCEFKVINNEDGSQIAEDILVLSYTENNELIFKDVLGIGDKLDSAIIFDVNTLTQKCVVIQHPLVKDFIRIIRNISNNNIKKSDIENFQKKLDLVKNTV